MKISRNTTSLYRHNDYGAGALSTLPNATLSPFLAAFVKNNTAFDSILYERARALAVQLIKDGPRSRRVAAHEPTLVPK